MILADKIIYLRKQAGWSQEDLAEEMNISRQSVSKWEGAQSIPDMDKILMLSSIFGVSTDFLLKDDMEELEGISISETNVGLRKITLEDVRYFINISKETSPRIALGVFLCITSPITLLLMSTLAEEGKITMSEHAAGILGLIVILFLVTCAVALFVLSGIKIKEHEFLETEDFELEYGVKSIIKEEQNSYRQTYMIQLVFGIALCILSAIPLLIFSEGTEVQLVIGLCLLLVTVACGVFLLVNSIGRWSIFSKILQEGDYQKKNKQGEKLISMIASIYWTTVTAIFLVYSFSTWNWGESWVIWPVAGMIFGGIAGAISIFHEN